MFMRFGKHIGKSLETVVLKEPDYVLWMLAQQDATGPLARAREEAVGLIQGFDRKPFRVPCCKSGCTRRATRCSVYRDNLGPAWFCDECDPYSLGAAPGRLGIIRSYWDAVNHVDLYCAGRRGDLKALIRSLALAKGLSARSTDRDALAFFADCPVPLEPEPV
jgi:hypothetical protein